MQRLKFPKILENEIHVWWSQLSSWNSSDLIGFLDKRESSRLETMKSKKRRHEFLLGRFLLKNIISSYLEVATDEIEIGLEAQGKPFLKRPQAPFFFNLSHSGDFLCVAYSFDSPVGIDLERRPLSRRHLGAAKLVLSQKEFESLKEKPEDVQRETLLEAWTEKEAVGKLTGRGLTHDESMVTNIQLFSIKEDDFVLKLATSEPKAKVSWKGSLDVLF